MAFSFRAVLAAIIVSAFLTTGCTESISITGYGSDTAVIDNMGYRINTSRTKAFAQTWYWDLDPENTDIYIPDTITVSRSGSSSSKQVQVTSLGGYMGTGVPCPFEIAPPEDTGCYISGYPSVSDFASDLHWEDLTFTVHIGRNVSEIMTAGSGYYGRKDENGVITMYHPVCYYECDPGNTSLYSKDGILYYREGDQEVTQTEPAQHRNPAGPVFDELSTFEKVNGRYLCSTDDAGYAVAEFFTLNDFASVPGNDAIYANIGFYTEDSLYTCSAAVITPVDKEPDTTENSLPDNSAAVSFTAGILQFSSFSGEGQFWNDEPDIYTVTVTEDSIVFTPEELKGEGFLSMGDVEITLLRDNTLPSLFPSHINDQLTREEDETLRIFRPFFLWGKPFHTGSAVVDILNDDVITVIVTDTEDTVPQIYRGICRYTSDSRFLYEMAQLGNGTMPFAGSLYGNGLAHTLSLYKEGTADPEGEGPAPDAFPLFPEGESMIIAEPLY